MYHARYAAPPSLLLAEPCNLGPRIALQIAAFLSLPAQSPNLRDNALRHGIHQSSALSAVSAQLLRPSYYRSIRALFSRVLDNYTIWFFISAHDGSSPAPSGNRDTSRCKCLKLVAAAPCSPPVGQASINCQPLDGRRRLGRVDNSIFHHDSFATAAVRPLFLFSQCNLSYKSKPCFLTTFRYPGARWRCNVDCFLLRVSSHARLITDGLEYAKMQCEGVRAMHHADS